MDDTPRITELRKKLEKDPGSRLFAQLAEELRKEGRHEDAIEASRSGLERHANYPSARLTLARALIDSGRPGEARPELEQVIKAAPDNILASRLLGEALEDLGESGAALRQFEQTLRLSPGDKALGERIANLKSGAAAPPAASPAGVPMETAPPAVDTESAGTLLPEVGVGSAPEVMVPDTPEAAPPTSMALDRDLASGTFSPGSLNAADLQEHFNQAASAASEAPTAPELAETVGFGQMNRSPDLMDTADTVSLPGPPSPEPETPPLSDELSSTEAASGDPEVGANTLPLTSVTLADLYLQQGLKAEASAVLSQVMKEAPANAEARSRFAAVSGKLAEGRAEPPSPPALAGAPLVTPIPAASSLVRTPPLTKAEIHQETIASLKAFLSAVEREAIQQRATEQKGSFR
jgi:tetratricopeptide (TPR) repeat protein